MANKLEISKTSSGIPVITEKSDDALNSGYMIAVNTGSRDESKEIWGISHLLEHVVFRATKTRDSFEMSKEIEGAGGENNAFTGKEMTAYYAVTIKETTKTAKDIVADIVTNPLIKPSDVEMEKKIVLQELSMCENKPSSYIHDLFAETMWDGYELGHNEGGTSEIVKKLKAEDLKKYYSEKYVKQNFCVFASGAVDHNDVVSWAEETLNVMPDGKANKRTVPVVEKSTYKHFKRKEEHCYVGFGFPSHGANHPDKFKISMLNAILGSGMSSRMFQEVREKKALVYSVYNSIDQNSDASSLGTFFSSTEENVLEAINTVADVYHNFLDSGLQDGELSKARNLIKGALYRGMESVDNRLYRLARETMLTGRTKTIDERIEALNAVTEEDVIKVAEDIINPKKLHIVMYGKDVKSMKNFTVEQVEI